MLWEASMALLALMLLLWAAAIWGTYREEGVSSGVKSETPETSHRKAS